MRQPHVACLTCQQRSPVYRRPISASRVRWCKCYWTVTRHGSTSRRGECDGEDVTSKPALGLCRFSVPYDPGKTIKELTVAGKFRTAQISIIIDGGEAYHQAFWRW